MRERKTIDPLRYFLDSDDDGHWYIVPVDFRDAWEAWANLPERLDTLGGVDTENELKWAVPPYAKPVNGGPGRVTFTQPVIG